MYTWDEAKRAWNLRERGLDFADAGVVYENPEKTTLASARHGEDRKLDLALVAEAGTMLALVYIRRGENVHAISFAAHPGKKGKFMQKPESRTDWKRVRREAEADAPIPFNREDELYDPNSDAEVEAFATTATVRRPGQRGPQKSPTKEMISIRLSREVLDHFRSGGDGWQSRLDDTLKQVIAKRK